VEAVEAEPLPTVEAGLEAIGSYSKATSCVR
jgi:hypothetical protein